MGWISGLLTTAALSALGYALARAVITGAGAEAAKQAVDWFLDQTMPAWAGTAGMLLTAIVGGVLALWSQARFSETVQRVRTVRDTVERQITHTDTVTETRPVQVTVYDTVETTRIDTAYVPVPRDFDFRGMTPENPVRVEGERFILTEWRPNATPSGRFVQSTYRAQPDSWVLDAEGTVSAGFGFAGLSSVGSSSNIGLSYSREPWTVRVAGGLGTTVTSDRLSGAFFGELSLAYELASW